MNLQDQAAFAAMNETCGQDGISRLEYFAAAALQGLIACQSADFRTSKSVNVAEAFIYAEMMCAESTKRRQ